MLLLAFLYTELLLLLLPVVASAAVGWLVNSWGLYPCCSCW
jgi:hypothetical protein